MLKKTASLIRDHLKLSQAKAIAKQYEALFNKAKSQLAPLKLPSKAEAGVLTQPMKTVEPMKITPIPTSA